MDAPTIHIDEFGPLPVVVPADTAEFCAHVVSARNAGQAIYPLGGRTMLHVGMPPSKPGSAVDLRKLDRVVDYPARDMTITVEAGITIARLQQILAAENQRLPIDIPQPESATLGGSLAVNVSGPCRYGFGTLRDYLIGVTMVNDEGREFKAGGRVVKNVAGYDICKLAVGSLGTLGPIVGATLKLRPLPEAHALLSIGCSDSPGTLLESIHKTGTQPVCVELLNRAAVLQLNAGLAQPLPVEEWVVLVVFEHNRTAVAWQVQQLMRELPGNGRGVDVRLDSVVDPVRQGLTEKSGSSSSVVQVKANVLPGAVADFALRAGKLHPQIRLQAHAGNGIVWAAVEGTMSREQATGIIVGLQEAASSAQGNAVVQRCPSAWKASLPIWGTARADWALMRAVKEKFDPQRIFNPGRFVDGI